MKKNLLFITVSAVVLFSCTEKIPLSTSSNAFVAKDTNYMAAVETPQDRLVLIEEATGVKCPNCPEGTKVLKDAEKTYPDRLVIVGEHGGNLTSPIAGKSKDTFQLKIVELLLNSYFGGDPSKPAAAFDRTVLQGGGYFTDSRTLWSTLIAGRITIKPPLNLTVSSVYDASTDAYNITIRGAYTAAVSKKQNLTIMLTQDKIYDAQDSLIYEVEHYEHNHVLREIVSNMIGDPILTDLTSIEAGRVFEKTLIYKIPAGKGKWKPENMNVVAFVHNSEQGDKEVQQAAQTKLKPE